MVSRKALSDAPRPKRATLDIDLVEEMCERYWDAFRQGYCEVGGRPEDYPTWKKSTDPVKEETRRCMRFAVEAFRGTVIEAGAFEDWFPTMTRRRSQPVIQNDADFVKSQKIARLEE
jgi:hypothetical protein